MTTLRSQPQHPDASLLMYAAGELPAADREAVEQSLAADPDLRGRLAAVADALTTSDDAFAALDATAAIDSRRAAARAAAAIAAWQFARAAARPDPRPIDDRRPRRWVVPAAVAAGLAVVAGGVALKNRADLARRPLADADPPQSPEGAGGDLPDSPLVVNAVTTLFDLSATAGDEEAAVAADPMPPGPAEDPATPGPDHSDPPFFDVPLVAGAGDGPP